MAETLTKGFDSSQAKNKINIDTTVSKALEDGVLSEAEGMDIMVRLRMEKGKIHKETRDRLSAFLEESDNGRNWTSLKNDLKNAPVADTWSTPIIGTQKENDPPFDTKFGPEHTQMTAQEIQTQIDAIDKIISDDIQSGDEKKLAKIISDIQEKNVLKDIPHIVNGSLKEGIDLVDLGEKVIERLEAIKDNREDEQEKKADKKQAEKDKTQKQHQTEADVKAEEANRIKERTEQQKSDFLKQLDRMEMKWLDVNDLINKEMEEYRWSLESDEDRMVFEKNVQPTLNGLKIRKGEKKFSDLVSDVKLEDGKLSFRVDPDWWDNYDSKTRYEVVLKNTANLQSPENRTVIWDKVKEAYAQQIEKMASEAFDRTVE